MQKECKIHGITEFRIENSKERVKYRCIKCGVLSMKKRTDKLKLIVINHKGGKCERCGYDKYIGALEFHHNDPNEKKFSISYKIQNRNLVELLKEVDKCTLLCANCHREVHNELKNGGNPAG